MIYLCNSESLFKDYGWNYKGLLYQAREVSGHVQGFVVSSEGSERSCIRVWLDQKNIFVER
jgi:hypothetical protein